MSLMKKVKSWLIKLERAISWHLPLLLLSHFLGPIFGHPVERLMKWMRGTILPAVKEMRQRHQAHRRSRIAKRMARVIYSNLTSVDPQTS
jgi:hypothetical protein